MPVGLVITPSLERLLTEKRGIVTVPDEDALVSCNCLRGLPCEGIQVSKIPLKARVLENHMRMMGDKFISRMQARGMEWTGGDLRMHGPRTSYQFNKFMADVGSPSWATAQKEDDPSHIAYMVQDEPTENGYSDYTLVGEFMATATFTEVIVDG